MPKDMVASVHPHLVETKGLDQSDEIAKSDVTQPSLG
jgi:hypothetical protein